MRADATLNIFDRCGSIGVFSCAFKLTCLLKLNKILNK